MSYAVPMPRARDAAWIIVWTVVFFALFSALIGTMIAERDGRALLEIAALIASATIGALIRGYPHHPER